jgi:hypothetical protein
VSSFVKKQHNKSDCISQLCEKALNRTLWGLWCYRSHTHAHRILNGVRYLTRLYDDDREITNSWCGGRDVKVLFLVFSTRQIVKNSFSHHRLFPTYLYFDCNPHEFSTFNLARWLNNEFRICGVARVFASGNCCINNSIAWNYRYFFLSISLGINFIDINTHSICVGGMN